MLDVLYVAGSVAFFAVMLAYVRGCQALGRGTVEGDRERTP
jgi:hypothetical protein